jgi:phage tail sheath gpL-like
VSIKGFVPSLSPSNKYPGSYFQSIFGQGGASSNTLPKYLLIVALPDPTTGQITANNQVVDIFTPSDADYWAGPGSEGALALRAAIDVGGINIKYATAAIASATAGTATLTIDASWTTTGEWRLRIGGVPMNQGIKATDTPATIAAAIVAYVTARPQLPVTAASAAGSGTTYVVTFTAKCPSARSNDIMVWQDKTALPVGMTSVLAGGTAVGNGAVRLTGGAGVEDVTTLLAFLIANRYHRIAPAQRDATNLGRWRTQLDALADPTVARMGHAIFATSGTQSATKTLAQTGLDNVRAELLWMQDSETQPAVIAASHAAYRLQLEQTNPNRSYDNTVIKGVFGQTDSATVAGYAACVAALDAGITPVITVNGAALVPRAITTRSLTATGAPDDGCVDVADSATPDEVRDVLATFWGTEFLGGNPYIQDDPATDATTQPREGVAYPQLWTQEATAVLIRLQDLLWITGVETHPIESALHPDVPRIVSYYPVIVLPKQHQLEGTVAQTRFKNNASA